MTVRFNAGSAAGNQEITVWLNASTQVIRSNDTPVTNLLRPYSKCGDFNLGQADGLIKIRANVTSTTQLAYGVSITAEMDEGIATDSAGRSWLSQQTSSQNAGFAWYYQAQQDGEYSCESSAADVQGIVHVRLDARAGGVLDFFLLVRDWFQSATDSTLPQVALRFDAETYSSSGATNEMPKLGKRFLLATGAEMPCRANTTC
jgi:hypothetical protein